MSKKSKSGEAARTMIKQVKANDVQRLAKMFKALAHPNRLEIYAEIMRREDEEGGVEHYAGCLLQKLKANLNIGAPTVSHHVKELVDAGLINVERNGKFLYCQLNKSAQRELQGFIDKA